jgi:hypothetical protein
LGQRVGDVYEPVAPPEDPFSPIRRESCTESRHHHVTSSCPYSSWHSAQTFSTSGSSRRHFAGLPSSQAKGRRGWLTVTSLARLNCCRRLQFKPSLAASYKNLLRSRLFVSRVKSLCAATGVDWTPLGLLTQIETDCPAGADATA